MITPLRGSAAACAAAAVCALLAGCGSGGHPPKRPPTNARRAGRPTRTEAAAARRPPRRRHGPPPGALSQTDQRPSSSSRRFRGEMSSLWRAIRTGSAKAGMSAFFPERAYAQVKAIADPRADYDTRLVAEYRLDIAAAHQTLGEGGTRAQLIRVAVPGAYVHWVDPGACYNRVGYYEVPNARMVYREDGEIRSIGIASMISWRGIWYVVHLGAVARPGAGGVVDDPSAGPGTSVASSTC